MLYRWLSCFYVRLYVIMGYQQQSFRIEVLSSLQPSGVKYAVVLGLIDRCQQCSTLRQLAKLNEGMPVWNSTCECLLVISKMIGYSGFPWLSLLQITGYQRQLSVPHSSRFKERILGCHSQENQRGNRIINAWMLIRSKPQCNKFRNTSEWQWDGVRIYRNKPQIEDRFLHPIYRKVPGFRWVPNMYDLPDLLGSWIGKGLDRLRFFAEYLHMHTNWNFLHQYESIESNPFRFWIQWWMTPLLGNE